jgi:enoyl-[acyl-carrier-protein] reductase (NADH)
MEQFLAKGQPYPRAGHPEDIAATALYLASDDSEFVTGQAIVVDGGMTVGAWFTPQEGSNIPTALPQRGYVGPSFEDK